MNLVPFDFNGNAIRVLTESNEYFFVAKDICSILGIEDHIQSVEKLDEDERGRYKVPTPGGQQDMLCVTEPGLFKLIFRSNKPIAKEFTRWVTHEVLPAIRKTGSFSGSFTQGTLPHMDDEVVEAEVFYDSEGVLIPHPSEHRYKLPDTITHSWVKTITDLYGKQIAANYFAPHLGVPQEVIALPGTQIRKFAPSKEILTDMVDFTDECITQSENTFTTVAEVYEAYMRWGGSLSRNNFGKEFLNYTGIKSTVRKINGTAVRVYDGIILKDTGGDLV